MRRFGQGNGEGADLARPRPLEYLRALVQRGPGRSDVVDENQDAVDKRQATSPR